MHTNVPARQVPLVGLSMRFLRSRVAGAEPACPPGRDTASDRGVLGPSKAFQLQHPVDGLSQSGAHDGGGRECDERQRTRDVRDQAHALANWLLAPVDGVTLGLFRIAFGVVLLMQGRSWKHLVDEVHAGHGFLLPYPMFGWIPVPPPWLGHLEQVGLTVLPCIVVLGYCTKVAFVLLFVCFSHVFLLCESNHNNHYILFCYALALAPFTRMDSSLSLDALLYHRRHPKSAPRQVPRYNLFLWQVMFSIPYSFGAVAKINADWLFHAQPLITWFRNRDGFPYSVPYYPWFIAWGGFAFDLFIVPLLIHPWTKYRVGFPGALMFNSMNKFMVWPRPQIVVSSAFFTHHQVV